MFHVWYHTWYHKLYDIIHDIIYFMLISYMISYMISYKKLWYHVYYHSLAFLALLWYCQRVCYQIWHHTFFMIPYMISQCQWFSSLWSSCAIFWWYCLRYYIHIKRNLLWYQCIIIWLMTSEHTSQDKALWYQ